jgi:hypothetical protein
MERNGIVVLINYLFDVFRVRFVYLILIFTHTENCNNLNAYQILPAASVIYPTNTFK